ncbi:MAG: dienelactone hydrolase family protein [Chloroflexota bacterium]|nr:dienelactone hydrolase family protein [Chloroflexota bacterium]
MPTDTITIPVSSGEISGYYAWPENDGPWPAVVIIHELFGLNENIRDTARRFAAQGYAALAVDLFHGRNRTVCMARFMGGMFLRSLDHGAIGDLKASLSHLASLPGVDPQRLGAIGFCMGGSFAIAWACTDDRLKVIAPFYSMNPRPLDAVARSCPVVGSFPEKDFTASGARKLEEILDRSDVPRDFKTYPGAKHSFFNDRGDNYDPAASEDAWNRTLAFFSNHLPTTTS